MPLGIVIGGTYHVHNAEQGSDRRLVIAGSHRTGCEPLIYICHPDDDQRNARHDTYAPEGMATDLGDSANQLKQGTEGYKNDQPEAHPLDDRKQANEVATIERVLVRAIVVRNDNDRPIALDHKRPRGAVYANDILTPRLGTNPSQEVIATKAKGKEGYAHEHDDPTDNTNGTIQHTAHDHSKEEQHAREVVRKFTSRRGIEFLHCGVKAMLVHQ